MTYRYLILFFLLFMVQLGHAEEDPMKSLFQFQQQMANNGSVEALMKLGRMYEEGQGTPRDLNKAMEMYQKAADRGHEQGSIEVKRIKREQQARIRAEIEAKSQRLKQEQAQRQAEKVRRKNLAKQKAKETARREAIAKQRAKEQARRKAIAKQRAKQQARRDALAKQQAKEQARREAIEKQRAKQQARQAAREKATVTTEPAEPTNDSASEDSTQQTKDERFKADPCQGPAAKLMTICKGKK